MALRVIMRIEVLPPARQQFGKISNQFSMTQVAVTSRLIEWVVKQPQEIQALVLGLMPSDAKKDVATEFLKRMAQQ